nr:agamous-like MADS-box protein AGL11 [Quercus suber]
MASSKHITKSTIERYKKACNDGLGTSSIEETNAQYYQQESAKLRQLIQNMQNSNRHLLGEGLSSLNSKEMKQLESRIEQGLTRIRSKKHEMLLAEIEYAQKRVMELENESVYLQAKIAEVERLQQVNLNKVTAGFFEQYWQSSEPKVNGLLGFCKVMIF